MTITDADRHRLYDALVATLGEQEAAILMEHLPPVGWADVATKTDLDHPRAATKTDLEHLRAATKADIDVLRAATKADFRLCCRFRGLLGWVSAGAPRLVPTFPDV